MDTRDALKWIVYAGIFAVPFVVLIVSESWFFPFITGKNFAFRILVEISTAAWVLLFLLDKTYRPRFSYIALGGLALLVVMAFANLFGEYSPKSFWSNFERMDGYVTLLHFYFYFLLLGTMLTSERLWHRFFNVALFAALLVSFYGFAQLSGEVDITQGGWRINSTLGNAAYMAVYMLFQVFIAAWMFFATKNRYLKIGYGALVILFAYLLFTTATRGTMLGLLGGGLVALIYVAIFSQGNGALRKVAISGLLALVLLVGAFIAFRNADFVQDNPVLERFANITLAKDDARFIIWGLALEGIKERPILGWGQENFSYVFNQHYDPRLYGAEQWYDRVHNITLDWLIAGGVLGFLAYFSILLAALYYLLWRPHFKGEETFTTTERALLLGIISAYFFHNLFVFDNLISYIFYAVILALIHSRSAEEEPLFARFQFDESVVRLVAVPVVVVVTGGIVYFVNIPSMMAAKDVIDALKVQRDPAAMFVELQSAIDRDALIGRQEVVEQMAQNATTIALLPSLDALSKLEIFSQAEREYQAMIDDKPGDARLHMLFGSFYRFAGEPESALREYETAQKLSPRKQTVLYALGFTYMQMGEHEKALPYFKQAYELEPASPTSRVNYAVAALYAKEEELFREFINIEDLSKDKQLREAFIGDDLAVQVVYEMKEYPLLIYMLTERTALHPTDTNNRVNLAIAYYENGESGKAINVLEDAIEDIPSFREQGLQLIKEILSGGGVTL